VRGALEDCRRRSPGPVVTSLQHHLAGAAGTGRARRLPTFQDPAAASRWRRAERRSMRVDIALVVAGHMSAALWQGVMR
jgi:hypothetical protein